MKKLITTLIALLIASLSFTAIGCGDSSDLGSGNSTSIEQSANSSNESSSSIVEGSQTNSGTTSSGPIGPSQGGTSSDPIVANYLITFKNGEEILQSESLQEGSQIVFNGEAPTKEATEEFTYTFAGWSIDGENLVELGLVEGEATYYALFTSATREYLVSWDINGTVSTTNVAYNGVPTKEDAYVQGLIFKGWSTSENGEIIDLSTQKITKDTNYFAVFTDTSVWDGTYPNVASGYTFKGEGTQSSPYLIESAKDLAALSRLTTGKKNFGEGTYYKITVNVDLSVGGWVPICDTNTDQAGWHSAGNFFGANLDGGNKTITFNETNAPLCFGLFIGLYNCTVQNLTLSGTINGQHYHSALAVYFNGGVTANNVTTNVNMTISNTTDAQARTGGIVGQVNGKGNKLINCKNTGNITALSTQSHVGGLVGFGYGGLELTDCSNTGTIVGKVTATTPYGIENVFVGNLVGCGNGVTFNVTFNVDGKETSVNTISGLKPTYSGTPIKEDDENYRYTFAGWSTSENGEIVELDYVQGEVTYYAVFTKTEFYTITFNVDGVTKEVKVLKNNLPEYNGEISKVGYKFLGWSTEEDGEVTGIAKATANETYYAIFEEITEAYTVTWVVDTTYTEEQYVYGSTPSKDKPTKADYIFVGWAKTENGTIIDLTKEVITQAETYYAVFKKADLTADEFQMQVAHLGGPSGTTNQARMRVSFSVKMKAGTKFTFIGTSEQAGIYKWTVNETQNTANMYADTYIDAGWNTAPKSTEAGNGWGIETKSSTEYVTQSDCYPVIVLAKIAGGNFTNDDINLIKDMFKVEGIKLSPITLYEEGSLTEEEFASQVAAMGSYPMPESAARGRIIFSVKMARGTKVSYTGTSSFNWAVVETSNNVTAASYLDSGWNSAWADPTADYISQIDGSYLVITVKKTDGANFTNAEIATLHSMFKVTGEKRISAVEQKDYEIKSINHRGYNYMAPENTLEAYKLSAYYGFKYVECDISFTKDGVPVLLHDETIDRTSTGTGNIADLTLEEARQYDYGSWFSHDYVGVQIPTLEEFLLVCKEYNLHPYIEIKWTSTFSLTAEQAKVIVDVVSKCGMTGKVSYISFSIDALTKIHALDSSARLGYVISSTVTEEHVNKIAALKTSTNEVFIDVYRSQGAKGHNTVTLCKNAAVPLEVWTADGDVVYTLDPYVTGVSSEYTIAGQLL